MSVDPIRRGDDVTERPWALQVDAVSKSFPGVRALTDVSMGVRPGQVHALLGENGAGKSTLIKIITGAERPDSGTVRVDGVDLRTHTPRAAQRLGVRVVHQERQIAADLSVAHNVLLDQIPGPWGLVTQRRMVARAQAELDRLGLDLDARAPAHSLSAAQQQLVELARAVCRRSALVVLDEPTASLRRDEVETLFRVIRNLRDQGTALLYISHHLHEVFEVADVATVLRNGRWVAELEVASTTTEEIVTLMFDRNLAHTRLARPARDPDSPVALAAEQVDLPPSLGATDLTVRQGEILALCGTADSGTSQLAELLAGVRRPAHGRVLVGAERRPLGGRTAAAGGGIGFVPADRKADGLLLQRPISENVLLGRLTGVARFLHVPWSAQRQARSALRRGGVRADDPRRDVITLSGGNQQRVVIARWLRAGSGVLVLDQPTAGVDIAAKFEIYQQLIDLSAQGLAIVVVSSDYEEICSLADRVVIMRDGRIVGEIAGDESHPERLYQLEMDLEPTTGGPP